MEIRDRTPDTLELEVFVHGAMCISYSRRCMLSNYLAGRIPTQEPVPIRAGGNTIWSKRKGLGVFAG